MRAPSAWACQDLGRQEQRLSLSRMADKYEVLYSRVTFAGSPSERGLVLSTPENGWIWLKDSRNKTIDKGQVPASKIKKMKTGQITQLGMYKVLLERIIREREREPKKEASSAHAEKENRATKVAQEGNVEKDTAGTEAAAVREFDKKPSLDQALLSLMHKHQVEAAKFVLARLLGEEPEGIVGATSTGTRSGSGDTEEKKKGGSSSNPYASSDLPVTGCILADEMGLGKSLSALCVLWSFVRHGRGKGVIVCPSSLVGNWNQEILKWLKGLHSKTIFVKSSQKDKQVYEFIQGHSSTHPLMVISYENFRSVAGHLNKLRNWETIVCDEGHRLKNAELTQTSLALVNCVAQRRLVLTGTPIQNDLDELFTVINFVCPGNFGTLEEFTSNFSDPIMLKDGGARSEATNNLKQQLKRILLRRVRDDVLSEMLPPRTGFTIYCPLTAPQRERYLGQADQLLKGLKKNTKGATEAPPKKSKKSTRGSSKKVAESDDSSSDDDGDDEEEAGVDAGSDGGDSSEVTIKRKREIPRGDVKMKESQVLPALMELRLTSNTSSAFGAEASSKEAPEATETGAPEEAAAASSTTPKEDREARLSKAKTLVERSGKIAVLDALLTAIKASSGDAEKAVVVSNFQNILGEVEVLARGRGWHTLRIDGDVPAERRMKLVSHFNNPSSPFFLMLLSARAGGVGLNLVGGSRLVLVDPDWNPATDQQAMGRIWRDGQTKPVFIYRLISAGSIEETILSRQQKKGALNAVISVHGSSEQQADNDGANPSKKIGGGDIQAMIFPRGKDYFSGQPRLSESTSHSQTDPVLKSLGSLCVDVTTGL